MTESDFLEAPCKNRCGEYILSHWDERLSQWVYDHSCHSCERKQMMDYRRRMELENSGLMVEEQKLTLEIFRKDAFNADGLDAAKRMALGDSINLYLHGPAGRGKTHLGIGIILARIVTSRVKFFPITKALMNIRGNLKDTSEDFYINKLLACDVLVMDDFGANKLTEWNLSFMDCFVDEWYRRRKKGLVITSNFSLKDVSEKISDRIASRLAQICEVHKLSGDDRRIAN